MSSIVNEQPPLAKRLLKFEEIGVGTVFTPQPIIINMENWFVKWSEDTAIRLRDKKNYRQLDQTRYKVEPWRTVIVPGVEII